MLLPDFEPTGPRPTDGTDPNIGKNVGSVTPEFPKTKGAGFTPQPSAGIDLSVMDPLPNLPDHEVSDAEPE